MHLHLPKGQLNALKRIVSTSVRFAALGAALTAPVLPLMAQHCNVAGGVVTTATPLICNTLTPGFNLMLSISGNTDNGRFGEVRAATGDVVLSNSTGFFSLVLPAGVYRAGYVAVQSIVSLAGVTNINQITGCFGYSNFIEFTITGLNAGTLQTSDGSTIVESGTYTVSVTGAEGPFQRFVLRQTSSLAIVDVNTTGVFVFDDLPYGNYTVSHGVYGTAEEAPVVGQIGLGCVMYSPGKLVIKVPLPSFYPPGSKFCGSPVTEVVEVTNPLTGRTWMDRNLGAVRVATSPTDDLAYGGWYQWGRPSDGHHCANASLLLELSQGDVPGHGSFIVPPANVLDWRATTNNNLWLGVAGVNNPCPTGFRLPTQAEWMEETATWTSTGVAGAFGSVLKPPAARYKPLNTGSVFPVGNFGFYWSSDLVNDVGASGLYFDVQTTNNGSSAKANGHSVRCIKD